jgi:hypothetical protein
VKRKQGGSPPAAAAATTSGKRKAPKPPPAAPVASAAAAAAAAAGNGGSSSGKSLPAAVRAAQGSNPKGGRPLGSGNRGQMVPRYKDPGGQLKFGCRSTSYTGVYRCKRNTVRWRTQFSYGGKVRGPAGVVFLRRGGQCRREGRAAVARC